MDCASPHDFEVYYDFEIKDSSTYPGENSVLKEADSKCESAFDDFVGVNYDTSTLDYTYYYPTAESWKKNSDRLVSCIITDPDVKTTGTLANAGR